MSNPLADIEAYHVESKLVERFERVVSLANGTAEEIRESEDYKELRLALWLLDHQKSIGCPF